MICFLFVHSYPSKDHSEPGPDQNTGGGHLPIPLHGRLWTAVQFCMYDQLYYHIILFSLELSCYPGNFFFDTTSIFDDLSLFFLWLNTKINYKPLPPTQYVRRQ